MLLKISKALLLVGVLVFGAPAAAQDKSKDKAKDAHVKQDIAAHRVIAQAHEAAAKCLESGKPEKECHAQLAKDCRGLALGKYCGMKHKH